MLKNDPAQNAGSSLESQSLAGKTGARALRLYSASDPSGRPIEMSREPINLARIVAYKSEIRIERFGNRNQVLLRILFGSKCFTLGANNLPHRLVGLFISLTA